MKIANLYASNVKRLKLIQITLDGKSLIISGNNEQGKSSALDSFFYGLVGKKATPVKVITNGAEQTEIYIDLTEEFRIERIITPDKHELKVRPLGEETASYSSPQDICNKLFGDMTFDPLEFGKLKPAEQIELLKKFLPKDNQLDTIEQKIELKYNLRTDVNKDLKKNDLALKSMKEPKSGLPNEEISVAELSKTLQEINKKREEKTKLLLSVKQFDITIGNLDKREDELCQEIEKIRQQRILVNQQKDATLATLDSLPSYELDIEKLQSAIENAESLNKDIRYRNEYTKAQSQAMDARIHADKLTAEIEELREAKLKIFSEANLPIAGLTFDENGILLDGIPYEQLSSSRQLLVSMKIGMALNPKLHTMFSKHGNDFDDNRIKELFEMADTDGYQLIIERINPVEGLPYIVIEDGLVKENNIDVVLHSSKSQKEDLL